MKFSSFEFKNANKEHKLTFLLSGDFNSASFRKFSRPIFSAVKKSTLCVLKAVSNKVVSSSLVNAGLSCDSHSTNTYLFTSGANRGKISLPGVIILKYLPLNCLLVSLLYKSDNEMNLNDCDRGTVPR